MVSIYSFQRRHFYLSQPFKRILCSLQTFHSIYHWLQLRPRDTGNHLPLRIIIFQSPTHIVWNSPKLSHQKCSFVSGYLLYGNDLKHHFLCQKTTTTIYLGNETFGDFFKHCATTQKTSVIVKVLQKTYIFVKGKNVTHLGANRDQLNLTNPLEWHRAFFSVRERPPLFNS